MQTPTVKYLGPAHPQTAATPPADVNPEASSATDSHPAFGEAHTPTPTQASHQRRPAMTHPSQHADTTASTLVGVCSSPTCAFEQRGGDLGGRYCPWCGHDMLIIAEPDTSTEETGQR